MLGNFYKHDIFPFICGVPMEKIDRFIVDALANKIFSSERVSLMLAELQRRTKGSGGAEVSIGIEK